MLPSDPSGAKCMHGFERLLGKTLSEVTLCNWDGPNGGSDELTLKASDGTTVVVHTQDTEAYNSYLVPGPVPEEAA